MALQSPPACLNGAPPAINLTATYQWDTEGRMTAVGYPTYQNPGGPIQGGGTYAYQYDNVGRLNGATYDYGSGPQAVATATYGPAGELLSLVQGSYLSETRTYNSLLQVTRMTAAAYGQTVMDMQYNYSATQNNGRIVGSNDYVTGENVSYSYDAYFRDGVGQDYAEQRYYNNGTINWRWWRFGGLSPYLRWTVPVSRFDIANGG